MKQNGRYFTSQFFCIFPFQIIDLWIKALKFKFLMYISNKKEVSIQIYHNDKLKLGVLLK